MGFRERLASGLVEDAHQVDDVGGGWHQPGERGGVERIALDDLDGGQQDQVARVLAPARHDGDAHAFRGEPRHQVTPDESGAAQHQHMPRPRHHSA